MVELSIDKHYWNLPVQNGASKRLVRFYQDGQICYEFDIELAEGQADFWTFLDLTPWQGKRLEVQIEPPLPASPLPVAPPGFLSGETTPGVPLFGAERLA